MLIGSVPSAFNTAALLAAQGLIPNNPYLQVPGVTAPFVPARFEFVTLPKTAPGPNVPVSEVIEEIVVSAKRVPWWVYALAGGAAVLVLNKIR